MPATTTRDEIREYATDIGIVFCVLFTIGRILNDIGIFETWAVVSLVVGGVTSCATVSWERFKEKRNG